MCIDQDEGLLLLHKTLINTFPGHCCRKVKLKNKAGQTKGYAAHPGLFQEYDIEPGYENGKAQYTSSDGKYVMAYTGGSWMIQPVNNR